MAISRPIVNEAGSADTSELWKNYKREQALKERRMSRMDVPNEAMSEDKKKKYYQ